MATFAVYIAGAGHPLRVVTSDGSIDQLGGELVRRRFLVGTLIEEGGEAVEPQREVLVPLQRIALVALER